ncbi:hypothetical protein H6G33_37555 [Calothrix sp. FACHB-1219]|uniref:hypothetical protein n=1 Tax=unclassified Calothrix TaxID=2619626 RepID=UPI00168412FA|nr:MULTISPECIES: hypothetical protein [unclassified Calothrix]MBD2208110.1 hypothetical protein [Calothrix sp. FACHB-168]MBD2222636.1 hypothetical protein [Calothrix sp. FACHB-1219]
MLKLSKNWVYNPILDAQLAEVMGLESISNNHQGAWSFPLLSINRISDRLLKMP